MSSRNSKSTSKTTRKSTRKARPVFDATQGVYRKERTLSRVGMGIRRGDTRHGGTSQVVVWKYTDSDGPSNRFVLSLSEARSLKSFLDAELAVLAR